MGDGKSVEYLCSSARVQVIVPRVAGRSLFSDPTDSGVNNPVSTPAQVASPKVGLLKIRTGPTAT